MCPISGGNWNNGTNAGAWALNLNNERSNSNNNVGGRSDLDSPLATRSGTVEQRGVFSGDERNLTAAPFLVAFISENQGAAL
jgi:hypothetical protein